MHVVIQFPLFLYFSFAPPTHNMYIFRHAFISHPLVLFSSPCHCHLITCFSFTANGEDSANTNVLVLRLVRGIRVFRILRSFTTFAETQTMVDVMVYVVFASKWVMCVLVGFILCVCTLELNWFG